MKFLKTFEFYTRVAGFKYSKPDQSHNSYQLSFNVKFHISRSGLENIINNVIKELPLFKSGTDEHKYKISINTLDNDVFAVTVDLNAYSEHEVRNVFDDIINAFPEDIETSEFKVIELDEDYNKLKKKHKTVGFETNNTNKLIDDVLNVLLDNDVTVENNIIKNNILTIKTKDQLEDLLFDNSNLEDNEEHIHIVDQIYDMIKPEIIKESVDFDDKESEEDFNKICEILDENLVDYNYDDFEKFYCLDQPEAHDIIKWLEDKNLFNDWSQEELDALSLELEELFDSFK